MRGPSWLLGGGGAGHRQALFRLSLLPLSDGVSPRPTPTMRRSPIWEPVPSLTEPQCPREESNLSLSAVSFRDPGQAWLLDFDAFFLSHGGISTLESEVSTLVHYFSQHHQPVFLGPFLDRVRDRLDQPVGKRIGSQ